MTLDDLTARNQKFQKNAAQITELIHHASVLDNCSLLIRSSKRLDNYFRKVISAKSEMQFNSLMGTIEDETDEIIFMLDQLTAFDKKNDSKAMTDVVKEGFDLLSVYALACDKVIESRPHQSF
ncbi:MAG: hypothetical protein NXI20_27870 [bacterium]|nr:hypothetical protein [bacterium]